MIYGLVFSMISMILLH